MKLFYKVIANSGQLLCDGLRITVLLPGATFCICTYYYQKCQVDVGAATKVTYFYFMIKLYKQNLLEQYFPKVATTYLSQHFTTVKKMLSIINNDFQLLVSTEH